MSNDERVVGVYSGSEENGPSTAFAWYLHYNCNTREWWLHEHPGNRFEAYDSLAEALFRMNLLNCPPIHVREVLPEVEK